MILIPHAAALSVLSAISSQLHENDYRKPVARGLLDATLQTGGYLSPDFVPVVHAFLVSVERSCEEDGCLPLEESAIRCLISDLGRCIEDSERYELETYSDQQRIAFASTRSGGPSVISVGGAADLLSSGTSMVIDESRYTKRRLMITSRLPSFPVSNPDLPWVMLEAEDGSSLTVALLGPDSPASRADAARLMKLWNGALTVPAS